MTPCSSRLIPTMQRAAIFASGRPVAFSSSCSPEARSSSAGLGASTELQEKSEKLLLEKFPEIERIFGLIGTAEIAVDPMGANLCDTYVEFKSRDQWRKIDGRPATKEQIIEWMRRELAVHAEGAQRIHQRLRLALERGAQRLHVRPEVLLAVLRQDHLLERAGAAARWLARSAAHLPEAEREDAHDFGVALLLVPEQVSAEQRCERERHEHRGEQPEDQFEVGVMHECGLAMDFDRRADKAGVLRSAKQVRALIEREEERD